MGSSASISGSSPPAAVGCAAGPGVWLSPASAAASVAVPASAATAASSAAAIEASSSMPSTRAATAACWLASAAGGGSASAAAVAPAPAPGSAGAHSCCAPVSAAASGCRGPSWSGRWVTSAAAAAAASLAAAAVLAAAAAPSPTAPLAVPSAAAGSQIQGALFARGDGKGGAGERAGVPQPTCGRLGHRRRRGAVQRLHAPRQPPAGRQRPVRRLWGPWGAEEGRGGTSLDRPTVWSTPLCAALHRQLGRRGGWECGLNGAGRGQKAAAQNVSCRAPGWRRRRRAQPCAPGPPSSSAPCVQ